MNEDSKSISELMDLMKADSDEFFGKKPTLTVGRSGRKYWDEPEDPEDRQCRLDSEREFVEDEAMLRTDFPDQGHKVSGGYKEGSGEITVDEPPHLTEWNEKS